MVACISVKLVMMSPLSFFIASIWFLSLFFISLASDLSILLIFSKNQLLDLLIILKGFLCLYLLQFCSDLISCLLLAFEFFCSCSSNSFNFDYRVLILDLSLLLMWACIVMKFPLDTALNVSQRFWYVVFSFSLISKNIFIFTFISLFIQSSFKSQLFSSHEVVWFWVGFLILSSDLIALWSERLCVMISSVFHMPRSDLLPIMWFF